MLQWEIAMNSKKTPFLIELLPYIRGAVYGLLAAVAISMITYALRRSGHDGLIVFLFSSSDNSVANKGLLPYIYAEIKDIAIPIIAVLLTMSLIRRASSR